MLKRNVSKILLVGSDAQGSLENAYERAFRKVGVSKVELLNIERNNPCFRGSSLISRAANRLMIPLMQKEAEKELLGFMLKRKGFYDVVIVFKGMQLSRAILERCRSYQPNAIWVNINPDDPLNVASRGSSNSHVIQSLSFYDLYCIWSRKLVSKLRGKGCQRVEYLPFGYDTDFHVAPGYGGPIRSDAVTFIGAWDRQREAILTQLSDYNLFIFGNYWDRVSKRSPLYKTITATNIYGKELAQVVNGSGVCLNLLRPQNLEAHNMRTFEIPAMGGLMLTNRSSEQKEFIPEEQACLMFNDIYELRNQLDRVIGDWELAARIRYRGSIVVRDHSYTGRAKNMLELLSNV